GALYCWGEGHLGDNDSFCDGPSPTPRRVYQTDNNDDVISHFVDVAAGNNLTCATGYIAGDPPAEPTDIDLWCWGSNARGQLGIQNGDTDFNADHPRSVSGSGNGTISGLATGSGSHACSGVSNHDEVRCWGAGTNYQLGYCETNNDSPARLLVGSNACGN
ncbi:MAG: hypothetical protein OSB21_14635, partial [Myxococcota bacterium]|nr:hypothetical protein [Myxococcota bacterium]